MDISAHDKTALELFKIVINKGPLTLYSANSRSNMPIGTIHRHFKEMIETEKIMIYEISQAGRKKISYGPTVFGFIYFYRLDDEIKKNLDSYFDTWIKKEKFVEDLKKAGFDEKKITSDAKESKKTFSKFIYFYAGIEDQLAVRQFRKCPAPGFAPCSFRATASRSHFRRWQDFHFDFQL